MKKKIMMVLVVAGLFLLCGFNSAGATSLSFSCFSTTGIELKPTDGNVGFQIPTFRNEGENNLTLGKFDSITGEVINGDAVLVGFLNIGTAPLSSLSFNQGLVVDPSKPFDKLVFDGAMGINFFGAVIALGDDIGMVLGPSTFQAIMGSQGTFLVGLALFTSQDQKVTEVPGLTLSIDILIGDETTWILPSNRTYSSIGGAEAAASPAPVPEPSTILLMGIGLLGLVAIKSRKQKS